jgi:hypothetical protein
MISFSTTQSAVVLVVLLWNIQVEPQRRWIR